MKSIGAWLAIIGGAVALVGGILLIPLSARRVVRVDESGEVAAVTDETAS